VGDANFLEVSREPLRRGLGMRPSLKGGRFFASRAYLPPIRQGVGSNRKESEDKRPQLATKKGGNLRLVLPVPGVFFPGGGADL